MYFNYSFRGILSASMVLSQLVGIDVYAAWHCPAGQPDACINEVNGWNENFRAHLRDLYDLRNNSQKYINNCWFSYSGVKSTYENSLKMYERLKGRIESLQEQKSAYNALYNGQLNQVQIVKQIQSVHYSYFREMIQALKTDADNGYSAELKKYKNNLIISKSTTSNQSAKMAIDMTIGIDRKSVV